MVKPPRNFKHFKHLRFMCVHYTICFTYAVGCIYIRKILKAFFCTLCVFCATIWAKMLYKNEMRPTHDLLSIVSRCGFEAHSDIIICHQQSDLLKSWVFKRKWLLTLFLLLLYPHAQITSHKIKQTPNEIYLINYPQGTLSANFMYVKAF